MLDEVHSVMRALPAIGSLPIDIDANFHIPAPILAADRERLGQAPINFSTPTGAFHSITPPVSVTIASGLQKVEYRSVRLTRQIFQGLKPADWPVETADFLETHNLETAQAIDLIVPDDLLRQADTITRSTSAIATDPEGDCRFQRLGCVERYM